MFGLTRPRAIIEGRRWLGRTALAVAVGLSALSLGPRDVAATVAFHVPVLRYHHVLPPALVPPGAPDPRLYVDPRTFDAQLSTLKAHGWRTVTARDLAAALTAGRQLPPRTFVITFDDGRPDQYTYAFPILQRYGFVATFFVVPGRIGSPDEMTAAELRALAAAGDEIANHTQDHLPLTALGVTEMQAQIRLASDAIQAITGTRPVTFAYPFGAFDPLAESILRNEGLAMAFTTLPGADETMADRLDAPRIFVSGVHDGPGGILIGGTSSGALLTLVEAPPRTVLQVARFVAWPRPGGVIEPGDPGGPGPVPGRTPQVAAPIAAPLGPAPGAPSPMSAAILGLGSAAATALPVAGLAFGIAALVLLGYGRLRRRRASVVGGEGFEPPTTSV